MAPGDILSMKPKVFRFTGFEGDNVVLALLRPAKIIVPSEADTDHTVLVVFPVFVRLFCGASRQF